LIFENKKDKEALLRVEDYLERLEKVTRNCLIVDGCELGKVRGFIKALNQNFMICKAGES